MSCTDCFVLEDSSDNHKKDVEIQNKIFMQHQVFKSSIHEDELELTLIHWKTFRTSILYKKSLSKGRNQQFSVDEQQVDKQEPKKKDKE